MKIKIRKNRFDIFYNTLMQAEGREILLESLVAIDRFNLFYMAVNIGREFTKDEFREGFSYLVRLEKEIYKNYDFLLGKKEISKLEKAKLCYRIAFVQSKALSGYKGESDFPEDLIETMRNANSEFYDSARKKIYLISTGFHNE